jgi:DNA (cytosine-5)-methyltransferase 1
MNEYSNEEVYTVLDLFCGCEGMTQGFVDAGYDVIAGIDIWDKAIESYKRNFNHLAICKDLTKYPPSKFRRDHNIKKNGIDIIIGGFPCQGFSIAGRRKKDDSRNSLFKEFTKYIRYFKPMVIVMENVIGLLSMKTINNEKVIDIIISELEKDYNCIICKLYACQFEVPQLRRRVIIIGKHIIYILYSYSLFLILIL